MSQPGRTDVPGMDLPELAELSLPAPVSMFPQTWAWKLLLLAGLGLLLVLAWRRYRLYRRRRWKRQARALAIVARDHADVDTWFALIKRVWLVQVPREQVATLSDHDLLQPLQALDEPGRQALIDGHHRASQTLEPLLNQRLAGAFEQWLAELPDVR